MKQIRFNLIVVTFFVLVLVPRGWAAERQVVHGHIPRVVAELHLQTVGRFPSTNRLRLAIGLPLRNREGLDRLLQQIYDPTSTNYHHYLTPQQFAEMFSPTEQDYKTVIAFAMANGFTVTATHPNRVVLDVEGDVAVIEKTLHVAMWNYQHPKEARTFYAPNVEPSLDLAVPVLNIEGLDNYELPHPYHKIRPVNQPANAIPNSGSGPGGTYRGNDFRAAYVPGTSLTGARQNVGLLEFDGYYTNDIATYISQAGITTSVTLTNVPIDGGVTTITANGSGEVSLDIEMVIAMAPGVSNVFVYEAPNPSPWVDLLNRMANDNQAKQLSCSWGGGGPDATSEQIFQQMAAQGQSFFNATGDSDAFTGAISFPSDSTNITQVGGTTLTTTGPGGAYISETVWNWGRQHSSYVGSSGGISTYYPIPPYQMGISMTVNQGSTTLRNVPDVALTADNIWVNYNNGGSGSFGGTSCAAPLWAGFIALVNEQAADNALPPVGFLNPIVYAIGKGANFTSDFHDTTTGNNYWPSSPTKFAAVTGYDLCTGWGTPAGSNLVNALLGTATVTLGNLNPVYDGTGKSVSVTTTPPGLTVNLTYNGSASAPTNAGSYTVIGTINDPNYAGSATNTLVIGKATATVTLGNLNPVYDGTGKSVSVTTTPPGLTVNLTYNGNASAPTNAGSYTVIATINDVNYAGSATNTLVINKATTPVTMVDFYLDMEAGTNGQAITTNLLNSCTHVEPGAGYWTFNRGHPEFCTDCFDELSNIADFLVLTTAGTNGVWPLRSPVEVNGVAYNDAAHTRVFGKGLNVRDQGAQFNFTTPPLRISIGYYYTMVVGYKGEQIGDYVLSTCLNNYANESDWEYDIMAGSAINYAGTVFVHSHAGGPQNTSTIGIALTKTYWITQLWDGSNGVCKVEVYNPVTWAKIGSTSQLALSNLPCEFFQFGDLQNTNSSFSVTNCFGNIIMDWTRATFPLLLPGAVTVTLGNLNPVYDGTGKSVSVTTTPPGLTVNLTYNGSANAPTNAGSYTVIGTINDVNYAGSATNTLVIGKATATVTLGNLNPVYDGTGKSVSVTTTPPGLTVNLTYNGSASAPTNAGSYTVIGTINDVNYAGSATNTLVISKATATVTLGNLNPVYDGTGKSVSVTTTPPGLTVNLTYNGSPNAPTNAGSYTVVGTINDPNYAGSATNTLVIGKATATVTLGNLNPVYDGTGKSVSVTTTPPGLTVNLTYNDSANAPTNAGSYTVIGTINDVNYAGSATNTLVIGKATATVTLGNLNPVYDGTGKSVSVTTTPPGLTVNLMYNGSGSAPTNAGSYTVIGTINDPNYAGSATNTLVISKATATVTLGNLNPVYDGTGKSVSVTTTPPGLTVNLTYNGSANAPTNAGSYTVIGTINDVNYAGSATNTLVIGKATATVTLGNLNPVYDGTGKSVSVTTTPPGLTVNLTYNGSASAPTNAGSYTVIGTINDVNYAGSATNTLVISKATATVTLGNLNPVYDGTGKSVSVTTTPPGLTVNLTYNGSANAPTNAGSYTVVGTINDPNYAGSATNTLVIGKATATVTLGNLNPVYDGTGKSVSVTTTPPGLTVNLTYNGSANAPTNAGSYTVVGTINDPNYAGSATNTLVISKATATVTLGNLNPVYDGTGKSVSVTTTPPGLTVNLMYNGSGSAPTNAGSYTVIGTINDVNYAGSATNTLVISKATATVTLGNLNPVYDGTGKSVSVTTTPPGLTVNLTYNGSANAPTNAGSYTVVGTINDPNYAGSATNTLVISKATATVTLGNLNPVYDGTGKSVSVTTTPPGLTVNLTYNGSANAPTNAGSYTVVGTVVDNNYAGSATNTLVISKATATVTLGNLNPVYDGTGKSVSVTTTPPGLTVNLMYNGSGSAPTNAGSYTVIGTINDVNYAGSATNTLVISKATATVTLGNLNPVYDGTGKSVSVTTTPPGLTVNLMYNGSGSAPTNAGSYTVIGTINDVNYAGSATNTLVIGKATATVTLGNLNPVYDGTGKSVSVTTTPPGLTVNLTYNGSANAPTNAGSYTVVGTINDPNYAGSATNTLVISKATATVTLGNLNPVYDGTGKSVSVTTTPPGLTVNLTYNGSANAPTNAGSYTVVGTVVDNNYAGSATNTLVISKATATVTLGNLNPVYDGTGKSVSVTTTPPGLTVNLMYNGSGSAPTNAGSYTVIGTINDVNYAGSATNTLVISKATATVTLNNLNPVYDGTGKSVSVTTTPPGLTVNLMYNGSGSAPTNAGSYTVIGTINDPNYAGSATNTLVIGKATATVTLGNLNPVYDGTGKSVSVTTTPPGLTVNLMYNGSGSAPTNAGSYTVIGTINDVNYAGSATNTLVISKATATVTLNNLNPVYDGTGKSVSVTTTPPGLTVNLTYNGSPNAPTNAGSYTVIGTINDVNYAGSATNTLVISKATATVTLGNLNPVYDGTGKSVSVTTTPPGLTVNLMYNGSGSAPTNAGSYTVIGTINDPNYAGSATNTLVIGKATATVTLNNLNPVYDGTGKSVSVTTTPPGLTVNLMYNGSGSAPTNAGSYTVVGTVVDNNYAGSATNTLVISKATATVTLGNLNPVYDGTGKSVSVTTTPPGLTVNLTYNGSANAPTNAGSYTVIGTINDPNYAGSATNTLVIGKATATVTLGNLNPVYDGTGKSVSVTTTPPGLTVNLMYNGSGSAPTNAGSYTVIGTINDVNYAGSATNTLVISKATATVTLNNLNPVYDGTGKSVSVTTTPPGLTVNLMYNGSGSAPTNAGSYTVIGTINDVNYAGSATNTLVIGKATATVTLGNLNPVYDGTGKSVSVTTTPPGLTVNLTYNGSANAPTNAGSYTVVGTINDPNYAGSATNTLVIGKATATVTLGNLNPVYDGTGKSVSVTTTPPGLTVNLTYNGSANAPTNAGSYTVIGTINDPNYAGSATNTLVISKATATVTLGNLNPVYDGTGKSVSVTTTPPGLTVNLTYNGSANAPTNAGSYTVVGTINDPNYAGSATNTLVIGKATATVTLGNLNPVYDGTGKSVSVTTTPPGLTVNLTYNGSANAPTNAGSYTVVGTINDPNYAGSATNTLVISKATATVTLGNLNPVYDGTGKSVSVTTTPPGLTVNLMYNGSGSAPTNAGSYTVIGTINDPNYAGSATNTLVISKATATVTLGNLNPVYDGTGKSVSVTTTPPGLTVNLMYNGSGSAPTNAGSYTVIGTINDPNYAGSATNTLVIGKATATVTLGNLNPVYDGTGKSVSVTTTPPGLTVNLMYNGSGSAPTNAGSYTVIGTINDVNYAGSATNTLVISKATATVTLGNLNPVYDGTGKSVSVTTTPPGLTVNLTYNGSGSAPTNAGSYTVVGTINDPNYAGSATNTLVIGKATATVTLGNLNPVYDGTGKSVSVTTTPPGLTVNLTYNGSPNAPTNAGSYTVIGTINDVNYAGSATNTLVIGKATATVTLGNLNPVYDGTGKSVSVTTTPPGLTVNLTYNGSASAPTNAGSYTVIGTINDVNYAGSATNTLVISKATATVTLGNLNPVYDGTGKSVSVTTTPPGLTVNLTYDGNTSAPTNAGSYTVVGTVVDNNYAGSATNTLVISKATATVTLGNLNPVYDGTGKSVSVTTTPPGLTVNLTYNGSANAPTNAGSYTVVGTVVDNNYAGSATNTLVIGKATATVTLNNLNPVYDGTGKSVSVTTTPPGLTVNLTYDGNASAPTNAGSYTVVGTVVDNNYAGSATNTLVIGKATATVTLGNLNPVYDGTGKSVSVTTTPPGLTVNLTYDGNTSAPTNAGSYTVIGTINDPNYAGSATNTLVIGKATATVTLNNLNPVYDGTGKSVSVTTTPPGLTVNLTYNGSANAPTNAGSYTVVGTINDPNYAGSATNTLVISKATATVTLNNLNPVYDGTGKSVSVTTTPPGLTVNLTYNGNASAPTNAGSYTVIGTINDLNYAGSATNILTVTAVEFPKLSIQLVSGVVTIEWNSASNELYSVEGASDLSSGFTNIVQHIPSTPPKNIYFDVSVTNAFQFFYRIKVE